MLAAAFVTAATWLAVEDPLPATACPVLVVLNGDYPGRADEGARLYRSGHAREIWLTEDPRSADAMSDVGTRSNTDRLVAAGVPGGAIRVIPGTAIGTRRELAAVAAELTRHRIPCAVAVTSPAHGARVRVAWWAEHGPRADLIVRHAPAGAYRGWRAAGREVVLTLGTVVGLGR